MIRLFCASIAVQLIAWSLIFLALSPDAHAQIPTVKSLLESTPQANGPRIEQVISRSGHPEVQKVSYPEPLDGEKIVVLPLPKTNEGFYDLAAFQVGIKFTVKRLVDSCNRVLIKGEVTNPNLTPQAPLGYFRLTYRAIPSSISLMACMGNEKKARNLEVVTELAAIRAFRENIVLYVPKDVEVSARVYQQTAVISGQEL